MRSFFSFHFLFPLSSSVHRLGSRLLITKSKNREKRSLRWRNAPHSHTTSNESENIKIFETIKKLVGRKRAQSIPQPFQSLVFILASFPVTWSVVFPSFLPSARFFSVFCSIDCSSVAFEQNWWRKKRNFSNANKSFASMRQGHRWSTRANKNEFLEQKKKNRKQNIIRKLKKNSKQTFEIGHAVDSTTTQRHSTSSNYTIYVYKKQ